MAQLTTAAKQGSAKAPAAASAKKPNKRPAMELVYAHAVDMRDKCKRAALLTNEWAKAVPGNKNADAVMNLSQQYASASSILGRVCDALVELGKVKYTPPIVKVTAPGKYVPGVRIWIKSDIIKAKGYDQIVDRPDDLGLLFVHKVVKDMVDVRLGSVDGARLSFVYRGHLTLVDPAAKKDSK